MPENDIVVQGSGGDPFATLAKDHPLGAEILKFLSEPVPKKILKKRPGSDGNLWDYVPWPWTARKLNQAHADTWSMELIEYKIIDKPDLPPAHRDCRGTPAKVKDSAGREHDACNKGHLPRPQQEILVMVNIKNPRGGSMLGVGSNPFFPNNPNAKYGDALKGAVSLALVNAGHRWGPGLELYEDEVGNEMPEDEGIRDAKGALRSALTKAGIPEATAPTFFSEKLGEDLPTLQDCLDGTGEEGVEAYWALIAMLNGGSE